MVRRGIVMGRISLKKATLLLIFTIFFLCNISVMAQDETKTIKIGYTLNNGTMKSPILIGEEGYGYEYLNTIFKYIEEDYELKFIYCKYEQVETLLRSGVIDVFGPVTYTEDLAEDFLYIEESFGDNFIFLSTLNDNQEVSNNYENIYGSTIAVQENNPNEYMLYEFLEENGLEAEVVYFTDSDYEKAMEKLDCDFCLCSSLQSYSSLTPVVNLGVVEAYYITTQENIDLVNQINNAIVEIHEKEYMYQEKLYLEYYNYSILSDSYVTKEEYALLQEQELYYIGIEDIYGPIGYRDDQGNFQGIAVDVMDLIAKNTGISYVFVEVNEDTTEEELQAIDFSFLSYDENGRENTVESVSFCDMPYILVERVMEEEEKIENIGILVHYGLSELAYEEALYKRKVVEFDSLLELQEAYNTGKIDSLIMTTSNMNLIRNDFLDSNFIVTNLDMSLHMCLIFQSNYSIEKRGIFDKIIKQLDEKAIADSILRHSTAASTQISLKEMMKAYPCMIPSMILGMSFLIIIEIIISSNKRRNELYQLLNYDRLTGLYSGYKFEKEVRKILDEAEDDVYSIVTIDIDHFKYVNDVFGYQVGNKVIQKVASCIQRFAPDSMPVARNSSDIFVVLSKYRQGESHYLAFKEEDNEQLFRELEPYIGDTYQLSFSIGIYDIKDKGLDINFMIDCANIARLNGKGFAHTTIHIYDQNMEHKRMVSTGIITNMVRAINKKEFVVYYQPKVDLHTKQVIGAEALVRWFKEGVMVPPNDFIPLFEKNGFIIRLDCYVLEEVCRFIKECPETPRIAVNLSGVTMIKKNIAETILEIVERYQIPHAQIELEITESAFIEEFDSVVQSIQKLRDSGFLISMDDFGVGISSLSRLKNIPLDVLKIDREFIWDAMDNEKAIEIVKHIINMAIGLELETVAEGIETKEQEELLISLGCDIGQGYYYSAPLPRDEFI